MADLNGLQGRINSVQNNINSQSSYESDLNQLERLKAVAEESKALDDTEQAQIRNAIENAITNITNNTSQKYSTDVDAKSDFDQAIEAVRHVYDNAVCFTRGTLIETPQGSVPIESLKEGDLVNTRSGPAPIKWIGKRSFKGISQWKGSARLQNYPVRIMKGAIGDGVPSTQLSVSPWHHLYVDNILVRAMDLVNGINVYQDSSIDEVHYLHIELEQFDVIEAHGMYSESWADGGNSDFFENVDVAALRPEERERRRASRPGFQVVRPGDKNAHLLKLIQDAVKERASAAVKKAA